MHMIKSAAILSLKQCLITHVPFKGSEAEVHTHAQQDMIRIYLSE